MIRRDFIKSVGSAMALGPVFLSVQAKSKRTTIHLEHYLDFGRVVCRAIIESGGAEFGYTYTLAKTETLEDGFRCAVDKLKSATGCEDADLTDWKQLLGTDLYGRLIPPVPATNG